MYSREVPAATGVPIHRATASHVQVRHQAITGVQLPAGLTRSLEVVLQAAAVVPTIVQAVHRAAAAVLTAGQAVPAEVAALTVVRAAPAEVAAPTVVRAAPAVVLRQAEVPTVPGVGAAALIALEAEAAVHRVAAAVVPRVAAHPVQDVKLSFIAGVRSMIPVFFTS